MTQEQFIYDSLSKLRGKMSVEQSIQTIKVLCFFAYKTVSYEINFSNVDFSEHDNFNRDIEEISRKQFELKNFKTADLLLEIIKSGVLVYSPETKDVFDELLNYKEEEILEIMEKVNSQGNASRYSLSATEEELADLVYGLAKNLDYQSVLDICSGECCMLSRFAKENKNIRFTGFENNYPANLLGRLKLNMLGIDNYAISESNIFSETLEPSYDLVLCHYPFRVLNKESNIEEDNGYRISYNGKNNRHLDWPFMIKTLNAMSENGKAFIITYNGALTSIVGKAYREELIKGGFLEAVINMPSGTLSNTMANYSILILSNGNKKVKLINAENEFETFKRDKKIKIDNIIKLYNSESNDDLVRYMDNEEFKDFNLDATVYFRKNYEADLSNPKELNEIATITSGFQYTSSSIEEKEDQSGNVLIAKMSDIEDGKLNYQTMVSADIEMERIEKCVIKENDILIVTRGAKTKLALVKDLNNRIVIPQFVISIIRCNQEVINPTYLIAFLSSELGSKILDSHKNTGAALPSLMNHELIKVKVPLIDLKEQEAIAKEYLDLQNKVSELKEEIRKAEDKLAYIYEDKVKNRRTYLNK